MHAELCKPNAFPLFSHSLVVTAKKKTTVEAVHTKLSCRVEQSAQIKKRPFDTHLSSCLFDFIVALYGFHLHSDRIKNWPQDDAVSKPRRLES